MTATTSPPPTAAVAGGARDRPVIELSRRLRAVVRSGSDQFGLVVALLALVLVLGATAPNFLTAGNLLDVARQLSFTGIVAFGMTLVIVAAEIDISVGSAIAFSSALFGVLVQNLGWAIWVAAIAVCAVGTLVGAAAGLVRALLNVPSFIVTLALFSALSGLALLITSAMPIPITDPGFAAWGNGSVLGIPVPVLILVAVFAAFWVLANRTTFGRSAYAIGGNAEAARLSGIPVARIRATLFAITGLLAAISGLLQTARLGAGNPTIGTGTEFAVITAVIVGGASLYGGRGSMLGTLLGVVFIGLLNNGMVLLGVNSYAQNVANGIIVLLAVLLGALPAAAAGRRRIVGTASR